MLKPKKHVIILGAGASITSGYPDANRLTELMCDRKTFFQKFIEHAVADGENNTGEWARNSTISRYYDSFQETVRLLRNGDFATMDELSNLAAGGTHSSEISNLKRLMRFVFGLTNPEITNWPTSDYRTFIHALFERKSQLRDDISIISFNYDPYFEFRLVRALRARSHIRPVSEEYLARMNQAATSGFLFPADIEWTKTPGFCHLKLHGTAAFPARKMEQLHCPPQAGESVELTTARMFGFETLPRLLLLSSSQFALQDPPTLLPWEIVSTEGKLLDREAFEAQVGSDWQHTSLYPLFASLWQRARHEIQEADKISFVGLSLGAFIEPELRFLFSGKTNIVQGVVANPENSKYKNFADPFYPTTLCGRLLDMLYKICPTLAFNRSNSEGGLPITDKRERFGNTTRDASEITARSDFADFIQNEL